MHVGAASSSFDLCWTGLEPGQLKRSAAIVAVVALAYIRLYREPCPSVSTLSKERTEHRPTRPPVQARRGVQLDSALVVEDTRSDYGARRFQALGLIMGRLHALVFTPRAGRVHVIVWQVRPRTGVRDWTRRTNWYRHQAAAQHRSEERPDRSESRKVPCLQQAHRRQEDDEDVTRERGAARSLQLSGRETSESSHDHCRVGIGTASNSAAPSPYRWHDFAR